MIQGFVQTEAIPLESSMSSVSSPDDSSNRIVSLISYKNFVLLIWNQVLYIGDRLM